MSTHQIFGTTIYIGEINVDTIYGSMLIYIFQDLIHKGYILALCHGNIQADILYTRLHSSCVTSELMRSLDCDCVQQLNGAIKKICMGNGILFYLFQEGRGCGYVGKSRACMNVQYAEDTDKPINTFDAYEMLGMQHDYRQYNNVRDILKILKIDPKFILLTNNPDKIQKFTDLGLKLNSTESIEILPNPFNQTYLHSKQTHGHILYQTKTKVNRYVMPYDKIVPFEPYELSECKRFIHTSSYYLPIKPVWNKVLMDIDSYKKYELKNNYQLVDDPSNSFKNYFVQLSDDNLDKHNDLTEPYWFQINVHYDIVTNDDYLVLKYGDCINGDKTPIIRIHSESVLNRFPLVNREYKDRYKKSLDLIIQNGCGLILILYNDGRGSGLGYYVMNKKQNGNIGVEEDNRDYFGAINLLKHYIDPNKPIDLLCGNTSMHTLKEQFKKNKIIVRKHINISNDFDKTGFISIKNRVDSIGLYVNNSMNMLDTHKLNSVATIIDKYLQNNKNIYSSGLGTSESHSKYLELLTNRSIRHIDPMDIELLKDDYLIIVFSQGLSPNMIYCLRNVEKHRIILITTVTLLCENKKKREFLSEINRKGLVLNYPKEELDDTLIRISGPFVGYCIGYIVAENIDKKEFDNSITKLKLFTNDIFKNIINEELDTFIESLSKLKNLIVCCDSESIDLTDNIRYKMIEGPMINTHKVSYVSFFHGVYQFTQKHDDYCVWFITKNQNVFHNQMMKLFDKNRSFVTNYDNNMFPLKLEIIANVIACKLIENLNIDQRNWTGKEKQKTIYDICS